MSLGSEFFTLASLKTHEPLLTQFISEHWLLSPILFMAVYTIATASLLPFGVFLSLAGGFYFREPFGELYVLIGFTMGSCLVYLAAKTPLRKLFLAKAGARAKKFERAFKRNAVYYLLFFRVIPLSPAWLINLASAFFAVRFETFMWTAFIGNIPATIVFVGMGSELNSILESDIGFSVIALLNWHVFLLVVALALLFLIPIFVKNTREKH